MGMDKFEIRRQQLIKLREECGSIRALAVRLKNPKPDDPDFHVSESYVSRMLYKEGADHKKNIGDDMVDLIEKSFNKPAGWMDGIDLGAWPFESISQARYFQLDEPTRKSIEGWVAKQCDAYLGSQENTSAPKTAA